MSSSKTLVGPIDEDVLRFTAGKDPQLDVALLDADCIGTAAHVTMLQSLPLKPALLSAAERDAVVTALVEIMRLGRRGQFHITLSDQDVHLAVERMLTQRLGDVGKRIHTARSRNDQVAVDMRLFVKEQLLGTFDELLDLSGALLSFARRHKMWPMVGRTHMQPAMPSSVGVWASAHAESLLDDALVLRNAYELNDRSPLGSAAGYGVPLPIDRKLTARLLGFSGPIHNVLYASNTRGKCESIVLSALSQIMLSLSRLAEDVILYSMPEFGYFQLPPELCTGSSIMPQKKNPDVLELVRAKTSRVLAGTFAVTSILNSLPGGYNRDLQEVKEPAMEGVAATRSCLRILSRLMKALRADKPALTAAFKPDVYAADRALELVSEGRPFREAYEEVRNNLESLRPYDSAQAIARKQHYGAPGGLDLAVAAGRTRETKEFAGRERRRYYGAISKLLGVRYPHLA
jgi:argininosuccinate lyase